MKEFGRQENFLQLFSMFESVLHTVYIENCLCTQLMLRVNVIV
jgi:hypothetical protein